MDLGTVVREFEAPIAVPAAPDPAAPKEPTPKPEPVPA